MVLTNARAEGVADRVSICDGDMRRLPFAASSFDAVVSSLALHNVHGAGDRRVALAEIVRVLRPGGRLALLDIRYIDAYAEVLRELGLREVRIRRPSRWIFPPARTVVAVKGL